MKNNFVSGNIMSSDAKNPVGRPKGSVNKLTQEMRAAMEAVEGSIDPAVFFAQVLANKDDKYGFEWRFKAAEILMPYRYPKLRNIEVTGQDGGPVEVTGATFKTSRPKRPDYSKEEDGGTKDE